MKIMYQRNDDSSILTVQQAFTGAQHNDIIKVMPYCEYCARASYDDPEIRAARLDDGVWVHDLWFNGQFSGVGLCTKMGYDDIL